MLLAQSSSGGFDLGKSLILNPNTGTTVGGDVGKYNQVKDFLQLILPNAFVLAGFILLLYLVFGGVMIISSAGNPKATEKGTQAITGAILGFVVIFVAYWLVRLVELITGVPIFSSTL
ncbi:hypothetical protein C5B42_01855 [Candidatus Cerribacteria bacterium 'Amazon FNV 2010 28 9']|uniref:Uncharacterized protein n=1 Tax=Candidatus Cerribacteria bacterium 'Amazon FNV 2010 28 9' TaxID=2081795 RepID=A0A317JPS3_9BACT|nr:MAG: hypothetical protein C5B42_01855 [Candidatus Cerribacteria bacterium 'Amazon FNV 2010 28 9']